MHRVAHCILLLSVSTVLALPSSPLGSIRPCVRTRSCRDGSWPKVATPQATSTPNDDRALNSSSKSFIFSQIFVQHVRKVRLVRT